MSFPLRAIFVPSMTEKFQRNQSSDGVSLILRVRYENGIQGGFAAKGDVDARLWGQAGQPRGNK